MKDFLYNKNTDELEIPLDMLSKGIIYAEKNNLHNIKIVNSAKNINEILDLSPLTENENIFSIYISDDVGLNNVDFLPLYGMKELRKITMQYKRGRIDFSSFSKLSALYITKVDGEMDGLNNDSITDLLLVSMKNNNCEFISGLSNLRILRISSVSIQNLIGIESLCNLNSLKITHSPNISDISSMNRLKTLAHLHIEKCKKLTDFSFLGENESICDLFLSDVDSLSFIPTMKKIKRLKFWNLKDGNLSYILNSSTLEMVDFYPNKKIILIIKMK